MKWPYVWMFGAGFALMFMEGLALFYLQAQHGGSITIYFSGIAVIIAGLALGELAGGWVSAKS